MKIAFFAGNLLPVHAKSIEERPLGGTETGLIRLSEALHALGHEVTIFTEHENPPHSKPRYLPLKSVENFPAVDAYVAIRNWIPAFYSIQSKLRLLWTGDSSDVYANYGLGDRRVFDRLDCLIGVSDWQMKKISEESGFPYEKTWVLKNGINPSYFEGEETRAPKRLIYSSTPYRGLAHIPRLITQLRKKHPDAEAHIFSSYKVYDLEGMTDFDELKETLQKTPGVVLHGSILQRDLSREFMKSRAWFYPTDFEETSCITALEAMAAGCGIVTTHLGALPETIADAGLLLEGLPGKGDYDERYLRAVDRLLSDDAFFDGLSKKAKERAASNTWMKIAERFVSFLQSRL